MIDKTFEEYLATSYRPVAGGESAGGAPAAAPPAGGEAPNGNEGGEPGGQPEGGGENGNGQPAEPDAIGERMEQALSQFGDRFSQTVDERMNALEERLGAPEGTQPGGEPAPQGAEPGQGEIPDPETDPDGYAEAMLSRVTEAAAQRAMQPLMERMEHERLERENVGLVQDYPELGEAEAAQKVETDAQEWAQDVLGARFAPEVISMVAAEPAFKELVHLAGKTAAAAREETPAGGEGPGQQLEPGGGASPGGQPPPDPAAERARRIREAEPQRDPFFQGT